MSFRQTELAEAPIGYNAGLFMRLCTTKTTALIKDAECSALQNEIVVDQILPKLTRLGGQSAESDKVVDTGLERHSAHPAYYSDASQF
jgi:alanine racemase